MEFHILLSFRKGERRGPGQRDRGLRTQDSDNTCTGAVVLEQLLQCTGAAAVASGDSSVLPSSLAGGTFHHFVRDGAGEQNNQIGRPNLSFKICRHVGKHFCAAAVTLTDIFVLAFHSLIAADDYYTHDGLLPAKQR